MYRLPPGDRSAMELSVFLCPSSVAPQDDWQWKNAIEEALLQSARDFGGPSSSSDLSETSTARLSPPCRSDSDKDSESSAAAVPHPICRHPRWHAFLVKGPNARVAVRRRWSRAAVLLELAINQKVKDKSVDLWPFLARWRGWCALVARWQLVELFRPVLRGAPESKERSYGRAVLFREGPPGVQEVLVVEPAPSEVMESFSEWSGLLQPWPTRRPFSVRPWVLGGEVTPPRTHGSLLPQSLPPQQMRLPPR